MNQNSKLGGYIGFGIKSKAVVFGYDNIKTNFKNIKLIVMCKTLSEKVKAKLLILANELNICLVETKGILGEVISRENCKVVGLKNLELCKAIIKLTEEIEIKRGNI